MHFTPEVLGGFDRNRFVTLQMMNGDALVLDRIQWPLGSQVAKIPGTAPRNVHRFRCGGGSVSRPTDL